MKKVKIQKNNTIFNNHDSSMNKEVRYLDFKENVKYYFDGKDLHEINDIDFIFKDSLCHITFNNNPELLVKIHYLFRQKSKFRDEKVFKVYYDDPYPAIYDSLENAIKDIKDHIDNSHKIKEKYYQQYLKKVEKIEQEKEVLKDLVNDYPEYFI